MLLSLRLKKIRLKQQKRLNESNLYLYKSITSYIQNSDLSGIEKEEVLQQIVDMMLQAQMENKPMKLIIGSDYEEFCKSIIKEYENFRSKTYLVLNYIQRYLVWMILMSIVFLILREIPPNDLSNLGITVDDFIVVNIIVLILLPASKKGRQETIWMKSLPQRLLMINKSRVWAKAVYAMMFILIFRGTIVTKIIGSEFFDHLITPMVAAPYIILMSIIIMIIGIYKSVYDVK